MTYSELANLIFPNVKPISYRFNKYPKRSIGGETTRLAPSPTGFIHTGAIYTALVNYKVAKQSNGVFLLRIEDTDQKRLVEGATDLIIEGLEEFGLEIKEGPNKGGEYGPYFQSQRLEIYHSFAKHLIKQGKAYPCWMTSEELENIRNEQIKIKKPQGIYGNYSKWRNKNINEYIEQLKKDDKNFVIRFRSHGELNKKIIFEDLNRGKINMTDNYNDNVLIKKNKGLPTYHLAHIVDDTLMRMTHIIRGEERLTSVPRHLQLFQAFDLPAPKYCHIPSILKTENGKKRKLSKRKDPEAGIQYLFEQGFAPNAIIDYLLTLIDSKYEDRYLNNIEGKLNNTKKITDSYHDGFNINLKDLSNSGSLFDIKKLTWWNNKYLSKLTNEDLYNQTLNWAKKHQKKTFVRLLTENENLAKSGISIERHTEQDPKRFNTFADIESQIDFLYDDIWKRKITNIKKELLESQFPITNNIITEFIKIYEENLNLNINKQERFEQLKEIGSKLGFAKNNKEFKMGNFIGKVGDLAMFLRIAICGSKKSPDLYSVMKILGKEKVIFRIKTFQNL